MLVSIGSMGITYSVRIKRNSSNINVVVNMNILTYYLKVEMNLNYERIKGVNKPDLTNAKDINKLTKEEQKQIENKIADNKALNALISEFNKVVSQAQIQNN